MTAGQGGHTPIRPGAGDAIVVVGVQNDFLPGGSLAVLLFPQILPIFSVVAPCQSTAATPSVSHRNYGMNH